MVENIKFYKIREVKDPTRGTEKSAGIDFYIPSYSKDFLNDLIDKNENNDEHNYKIDIDVQNDRFFILIKKGGNILFPSGYKIVIPENHAFIAFNKSSVAFKKGLLVGACIVDEDYRGEVHINLINSSNKDVKIYFDEKICQFVLTPITYCNIHFINKENFEYYENTERGSGGFGSTNKE